MLKRFPRFKKIAKISLYGVLILIVLLVGVFLWWRQKERSRLLNGSQIIETSHGLVEFSRFGEGPAVLVLHGTIGGYDQAETLAEMVGTQAYQFISVSRPGYLRTPLSTGPTLTEQADAYVALLDELSIDQVAIMAISGGGPPALQFSLRYPERTWGLVMIAASSDFEVSRDARKEASGESNPPPGWLLDLIFSDALSWVITSAAHWQPEWILPLLVGETYTSMVLDDPVKYHLYTGLVNSFSLTSLRRDGSFNDNAQFIKFSGNPYESIKAPMLILQGTEDDFTLEIQQQYLHKVVPNSTYVEIEGGTHYMPASHNDFLAPIIREFLEEHRPQD